MPAFTKLLVLCWNVNKLRQLGKREAILQAIRKSKANVIFLQEVNATEAHQLATKDWLGPSFSASYEAYVTAQCAIIIRKNTFYSSALVYSQPRIIHIRVTPHHKIPTLEPRITGSLLNLVCVYAPAERGERQRFFLDESNWGSIPNDPYASESSAVDDRSAHYSRLPFTILAGDLNDAPNREDIFPLPSHHKFRHDRIWYPHLAPLLNLKGLIDPLTTPLHLFDTEHTDLLDLLDSPTQLPHFYTRTTATSSTRIDHILLSRSLEAVFQPSEKSYFSRTNSMLTDHSQVFLQLSLPQPSAAIPEAATLDRRWTLHPSWCNDVTFMKKMLALPAPPLRAPNQPQWSRWAQFHDEVQRSAFKLSKLLPPTAHPATQLGPLINKAGNRLDTLILQEQAGTPEFLAVRKELRQLELSLVDVLQTKYKDYGRSIEEVPRSWITYQAGRGRPVTEISSLTGPDGTMHDTWPNMQDLVVDFYSALYTPAPLQYTVLNHVLHTGNRSRLLDKEACRRLRRPFTKDELEAAAIGMNGKSVSGEDGLPLQLFQKLPQLLEVLAEYGSILLLEAESTCPPDTPRLLVSLLHKKGPPNLLANYRPVSLINFGERILSTAINERLQSTFAAHRILPPSQTSYVSGRLMSDSILRMQLFISANLLGLTNQPQTICFLDQEKAFDKINQRTIARALDWYGLPRPLIQYFNKTWSQANSRYKLNGRNTSPVNLHCGVLQGDPAAALIFCIATQIFIDLMNAMGILFRYKTSTRNTSETAINQAQEQTTHWPQYADDWAPVVDRQTAPHLLHAIDCMAQAGNISINHSKTNTLDLIPPSSTAQQITDYREHMRLILPYPHTDDGEELRYLGVYIRSDGQPPSASQQALLAKAHQNMHVFQAFSTSWAGSVRVANAFFTSQLWHCFGSAGSVDTIVIGRELNQILYQLIFRTKRAMISLMTLSMPRRYGGLGLIHVRHMLPAMAGRDLARGLNDKSDLGSLFRQCLTASSQIIGESDGVWLHRQGRGWHNYRKTRFQPMWLRLSKAADQLNLTANPSQLTSSEALSLPWLTPETDANRIFNAGDRSCMRLGGLITWGDILHSTIHSGDQDTLQLCSTDLTPPRIRLDRAIPQKQRSYCVDGWHILRSKWQKFEEQIPDVWRNRLKQPETTPRASPRWLSPQPWPNILLPSKLLLAGLPLDQYSIKAGRKYLISKEIHSRMLPKRHLSEFRNQFEPAHLPNQVITESDNESDEADENEGIVQADDGILDTAAVTEAEEQRTQFLSSRRQRKIDISDPIWMEVNQFWAQLHAASKKYNIPASHYTYIHSAYHGTMPTPLLNRRTIVCCHEETGSRRHRLHTCKRATAAWKHMNEAATHLGIQPAVLNERECVEFFPVWRGEVALNKKDKIDHTSSQADITLLKILLITTHIKTLVRNMSVSADSQADHHPTKSFIGSIRRDMADYDIFDSFLATPFQITPSPHHSM
jgi:exonuclease III